MDSGDRGTVRFVPDDLPTAGHVLDNLNLRYQPADVLMVDIPSHSGGFRKICERLAAEHLNIDYAYCSFSHEGGAKGGGIAVIKVNDLVKAQKVLSENGATSRRTVSAPRKKLAVRRALQPR